MRGVLIFVILSVATAVPITDDHYEYYDYEETSEPDSKVGRDPELNFRALLSYFPRFYSDFDCPQGMTVSPVTGKCHEVVSNGFGSFRKRRRKKRRKGGGFFGAFKQKLMVLGGSNFVKPTEVMVVSEEPGVNVNADTSQSQENYEVETSTESLTSEEPAIEMENVIKEADNIPTTPATSKLTFGQDFYAVTNSSPDNVQPSTSLNASADSNDVGEGAQGAKVTVSEVETIIGNANEGIPKKTVKSRLTLEDLANQIEDFQRKTVMKSLEAFAKAL